MSVEIGEETVAALAEYATIPSTFCVRSQLRVDWIDGGLGGIRLFEQAVDQPYLKDYDAFGETPLTWARQWDISKWGIFVARDHGEAVGGAVIAWQTPGLHMLEGRDDLAVLWDLRVTPARKRQGIGKQLFRQTTLWASQRHCRTLKIETQNNNVAACRFYAACGGRLGGVHPKAYAGLPEEVMLLWYLDLQ